MCAQANRDGRTACQIRGPAPHFQARRPWIPRSLGPQTPISTGWLPPIRLELCPNYAQIARFRPKPAVFLP